jgi:sialidase-1
VNPTTIKIPLLILLLSISATIKWTKASRKISQKPGDFYTMFSSGIRNSASCYRIPAMVSTPGGAVIAVADERVPSCGDLKVNDDINIVMRRSTDHGASWSQVETIVDYPPGQSASDPSMIVDKVTNEVFLFFNYMDLTNEKDVYYLKFIKSKDDGRTWSSPVDITRQITKAVWKMDFQFITSGRGIQTRSGQLLHTLVNLQRGLHLFASDDHGKHWYLINGELKPGDESKVVELLDGSWMVNSRMNGSGYRYVHTSVDQGRTWITRIDSALIDPSCNASIIRYPSAMQGEHKNRLIFANAASSEHRINMTVRISYDEGTIWSEGKTVYEGSAAYSSLSILADGDVGLLFEKDQYGEIVFVKLPLAWLENGSEHGLKH